MLSMHYRLLSLGPRRFRRRHTQLLMFSLIIFNEPEPGFCPISTTHPCVLLVARTRPCATTFPFFPSLSWRSLDSKFMVIPILFTQQFLLSRIVCLCPRWQAPLIFWIFFRLTSPSAMPPLRKYFATLLLAVARALEYSVILVLSTRS